MMKSGPTHSKPYLCYNWDGNGIIGAFNLGFFYKVHNSLKIYLYIKIRGPNCVRKVKSVEISRPQ